MAAKGIQSVKLVQLNIWQGRLLRQILDFLQQEQPDFMCLQEIYSSNIDSPAYDFLNSFEKVKTAFPGYHGFFSATYDMPFLGEKFKFGNAVLSRYPLTDNETVFINNQYHSYETSKEYHPREVAQQRRNLQRTMVNLGDGKTFCLINHHGYWEPTPIGSETTVEKMEKAAAVIKASPRPLILAGDLNIVPASPAMKPIQAQLRDLTQEYGLPTTLNQFGKVQNVACDHICVSEGIDVQSFGTSDVLVSDHLPLVMEFDVA